MSFLNQQDDINVVRYHYGIITHEFGFKYFGKKLLI